jgi:3'-5' exoribonuclease
VTSVFHDYGKINEYQYKDGKSSKLLFSKRVGHVAWSWSFFISLTATDERRSDVEEIGHAILAHHGRREWGSPVEPDTRLAYIVHTADMLSARGIEAHKESE